MNDGGPRLVIDTSVSFKWYMQDGEQGVAPAWELLERHRSGEVPLAAPEHMRLELLNALKSRRCKEAELLDASDHLELARLEWHPVDAQLSRAAGSIAAQYGLTLYDAAFAALAVELNCELVTADRRLASCGACRARLLG